ncbi:MAG: hypothetical protein QM796_06305 [Chthoniobacteraceae bacterium]
MNHMDRRQPGNAPTIHRLVKLGTTAFLLSLVLSACAHKSGDKPPAHLGLGGYEQYFDPSRGSSHALAMAEQGDREALTAFFLCAYVRLNQRSGDSLDTIRWNFSELIKCIGDDSFSDALARERPEVQSAAAAFIDLGVIKKYDLKTAQLLQQAPAIDWPKH